MPLKSAEKRYIYIYYNDRPFPLNFFNTCEMHCSRLNVALHLRHVGNPSRNHDRLREGGSSVVGIPLVSCSDGEHHHPMLKSEYPCVKKCTICNFISYDKPELVYTGLLERTNEVLMTHSPPGTFAVNANAFCRRANKAHTVLEHLVYVPSAAACGLRFYLQCFSSV